jgi:hypothetical protein
MVIQKMKKKILMVSAILVLSIMSLTMGQMILPANANQGALVCDKTSARFQETVNCQVIDQTIAPLSLKWWYNGAPAPCDGSVTCGFIMPNVHVLIIEICTPTQSYQCLQGARPSDASEQVLVTLREGAVLTGTNVSLNQAALALYVGLVSVVLAVTSLLILHARRVRISKQDQ